MRRWFEVSTNFCRSCRARLYIFPAVKGEAREPRRKRRRGSGEKHNHHYVTTIPA